MKVHVVSKNRFDTIMEMNGLDDSNIEERDDFFLISIVDTDKWIDTKEPHFKENHENVLNLVFDDVEHDGEPSPTNWDEGTRAFTEKQAKEVFDFIQKHREKKACIVHCMAGISRSGAIGSFINGYCGGDWEDFKRTNPQINPNARVHRMLNEAKYKSN